MHFGLNGTEQISLMKRVNAVRLANRFIDRRKVNEMRRKVNEMRRKVNGKETGGEEWAVENGE